MEKYGCRDGMDSIPHAEGHLFWVKLYIDTQTGIILYNIYMTYRKFWGVNMVNPAEDLETVFHVNYCELSRSPWVLMLWCLMQWSAALRRANSGNELWPCSKRCPWRKWLGAAQAAWKVSLAAVGMGPQKGWNTFPKEVIFGEKAWQHFKKTWTISPYPFKTWTISPQVFGASGCTPNKFMPAESCQLNQAVSTWDFRTWNWGETKPSELQLCHQRLWEREPMAAGHLSLSVSSGYGR